MAVNCKGRGRDACCAPIAICPEGGMKGGRVAEPFAAILAFSYRRQSVAHSYAFVTLQSLCVDTYGTDASTSQFFFVHRIPSQS